MKILNKVIASIVVLIMIIFNSRVFAVENITGIVNVETLRLRKEASTDSAVLELLSKDEKVDILEEKDGWYKVKFKDYTGYVSKEFITTSGDVKNVSTNNETQNDTNDEKDDKATTGTVQIKKKDAKTLMDVKLYMLPLINSNSINEIEKDSKVVIINVVGGWAYVNTNKYSGWVRLDKLYVNEANSPQVNKENNEEKSNKEESSKEESSSNNNEEATKKSEEENKEETNKSQFEERTAYIKGASVNIRSGASTSTEIITTLSQNTEIKLKGEEDGWYKVEVNGKIGYVLSSLVSNNKVEVTSRSAVAERSANNSVNNTNTSNTVQNTQSNQVNSEKANTQTQSASTSNSAQQSQEQTNTETAPVQTSYSKGEEVVNYAKQFLGCKYVYGGAGPYVFDCSGFTMFVYNHFGVNMGHSAVTQAYVGYYVPRSNLQPGDLIIINNESNTSIGHVGMYVGGGNFIHASSGSGQIIISPLSNAYYNARYVTARRIF